MNQYYLFVLPASEQHSSVFQEKQCMTLSYPEPNPAFEVNNKILLLHKARQVILPYVTNILHVNRPERTITLTIEDVFNEPVTIERAVAELKRPLAGIPAFTKLKPFEYNALLNQMGGMRLKEQALLDYIKLYIAARGYYFDDETLYNYHICLKTRPFVILAGLSGTGKSKLSQLYAEALGYRHHYLRLAVRPNWNDDRYLLGYFNTITSEYITEPAVEFVLDAGNDEDNLYFFCLDEMNLAHVEYYFSQFLSALEEERPEDRRIPLLGKGTQQRLEELGKKVTVPTDLLIPPNLLFTGTINVDETTQPLSDKVIDRANTLEFFAVELDKIPERSPLPDPITVSAAEWHNYKALQPDNAYRDQIVEIGKILNKADTGLGYRVLHDIGMYLANSGGVLAPKVAFDLQVKQRILPRVRGTEAISNVLDDLLDFMKRNNLPHSEKRLDEMKFRLKRDGYTNFWR